MTDSRLLKHKLLLSCIRGVVWSALTSTGCVLQEPQLHGIKKLIASVAPHKSQLVSSAS
jgi:hypothetical protein